MGNVIEQFKNNQIPFLGVSSRNANEFFSLEYCEEIDLLPERERETIYMYYEQGLNQQEIAEKLKLEVSTICRSLQKAIEILRKRWTK